MNATRERKIMLQSTFASRLRFVSYRVATILSSFKELYTLSPERTAAFLDSYSVFDQDWLNEDDVSQQLGLEGYEEAKRKIIDYYTVLNLIVSLGPLQKMYLPPVLDRSASVIQNQLLYEAKFCADLGIGQGDQVLDIGCGLGRVAANVASTTGAHVTGINISEWQLDSAQRFARANGLDGQCRFELQDLNDVPYPFPAESFDYLYNCQCMSGYIRDKGALFRELNRILKPGGKLVCLDWLLLDAYDAENPLHVNLMKDVKPILGLVTAPTVEEYVDGMRKADFEIVASEEISLDTALLFDRSASFFRGAGRVLQLLVKAKVLPQHFQTVFERLNEGGDACVEADRLGLSTFTWYTIAQKPGGA